MPFTNNPQQDSKPKAPFSTRRKRGLLALATLGITAVVAGLLSTTASTAQAVASPHAISTQHVAARAAIPNAPQLEIGLQIRECSGTGTGSFASPVSTGNATENSLALSGTIDECNINKGPADTNGGTFVLSAPGNYSCTRPSSATGSGSITWNLNGNIDKIGTSTPQDGEADAADNTDGAVANAAVTSGQDDEDDVEVSIEPTTNEVDNCLAGNFTNVTVKVTVVFYSGL